MKIQLVSKCRILILMTAVLFLSGCVTNSVYKSESALSIPLASKILVFPADVIVAESKPLVLPSLKRTNRKRLQLF